MNMHKWILAVSFAVTLLVLASGCANQEYARDFDTDDFRCYGDRVAYCEGHSPTQLECTCIDDVQLQRLEQQLRGLY